MAARRFLVPLLLIMFVLLLAGSMAPDPDQAEKPELPAQTAIAPAETVTGRLPADRTVRATVGDTVELEVLLEEAGSAEIEELGQIEAGTPESPARFEFLADEPGRYEVRSDTGGRLGTVDVRREE